MNFLPFFLAASVPPFERLLSTQKGIFISNVSRHGFLSAIGTCFSNILRTFSIVGGRGSFLSSILVSALAITFLFVVYRIIKRALTRA